jgi:hypothetical protein
MEHREFQCFHERGLVEVQGIIHFRVEWKNVEYWNVGDWQLRVQVRGWVHSQWRCLGYSVMLNLVIED